MRRFAIGMLVFASSGCSAPDEKGRSAEAMVLPAAVAFDGADYEDQAARVAHGKRLATLFGCDGCHGADYSGRDFGAAIPVVAADERAQRPGRARGSNPRGRG